MPHRCTWRQSMTVMTRAVSIGMSWGRVPARTRSAMSPMCVPVSLVPRITPPTTPVPM